MPTKPNTPLGSYRESQKLTLADLGATFGIDKSTMLRWERGSVPLDRLTEVSDVTGIPPAVLRPDVAAKFVAPAKADAA